MTTDANMNHENLWMEVVEAEPLKVNAGHVGLNQVDFEEGMWVDAEFEGSLFAELQLGRQNKVISHLTKYVIHLLSLRLNFVVHGGI